MTNPELLQDLEKALHSGSVDVVSVLGVLEKFTDTKKSEGSNKLMHILSFIGGGIVFMGIAFWVGQEWKHFGSSAKILCTLGIAIGFFISAVLLSKNDEQEVLSNTFFAIAALLMPFGLGVTYDELEFKVDTYSVTTQISGILTAVFLSAYFLFRRNLLLIFAIIFASCLFFIATDWMLKDQFMASESKFYLYRIFFVGLTWTLLGHAFSDSVRKPLTSFLYVFGIIAILSSAMALGGWKPNQSVFWELIYPGLALGIVFLSTVVKSRSFLIFGSLGFGAYICKITAEYFSDSLGWPLALILMGSAMIGIAFGAVRIRKKYLQT
ncbi:MAG: hypothetical protein HKN88_05085 [Gammaproteobacteria bacterium]|nr:hypothetical protein [Gammaproteobacteria bacterium]NNM13370.1 hypothetical protein [Gammaproteobacteria bacterium]